MQQDAIVHLSAPARRLDDPFAFILSCADKKRVLNVGASGGVEQYLPDNRDAWLHHRLSSVAAELVGIDIDADSIAYAARHGVALHLANCETHRFERPFDLIVLSDVIEHVNAPLEAINNLAGQLTPQGRLLITTPNPTHYSLVARAWLGGRPAVYYDHVAAWLPEHFQVIGDRLGLRLTDAAFFSHMDRRTASTRFKSAFAHLAGRLAPRSLGSFLVVLQPGDPK